MEARPRCSPWASAVARAAGLRGGPTLTPGRSQQNRTPEGGVRRCSPAFTPPASLQTTFRFLKEAGCLCLQNNHGGLVGAKLRFCFRSLLCFSASHFCLLRKSAKPKPLILRLSKAFLPPQFQPLNARLSNRLTDAQIAGPSQCKR